MPTIQELMPAPSFGGELGKALGGGIGQGISAGLQKQLDQFEKNQKTKSKTKEFIDAGWPEDLAILAANATTGGETQILKEVLEQRKRGISPGEGREIQEPTEEIDIPTLVKKSNEGLTPTEKFTAGQKRYEKGLPIAQEANTKLHGLQRDKERLNILESLEKTGKLPKNFGRLNVDKEGNLRIPFLAGAAAERFIKTLNEFSTGAKDTFGSRVTNFDLAQYLKRYPTLLNSAEGRKQLYQQMKIVNDINAVYYKELKKVFDQAGGVRNIDADVALSIAEKKSEKQVNELAQKFNDIGQFSTLPSASEFKGKTLRDTNTGELFKSDGNEWIPVE